MFVFLCFRFTCYSVSWFSIVSSRAVDCLFFRNDLLCVECDVKTKLLTNELSFTVTRLYTAEDCSHLVPCCIVSVSVLLHVIKVKQMLSKL